MSDTKFLKILTKIYIYIYIKWIKKYPHFLLFFIRILAVSYFPNTMPSTTQHPATPQYEIKAQYWVFSPKKPNTKHFNALTHWIDPMLRVHHLPKLRMYLVPTLASLDVKNLTHFLFIFILGKVTKSWEGKFAKFERVCQCLWLGI